MSEIVRCEMWDGCVTWCERELCAGRARDGRREHLGPLLVTSGDLWALSWAREPWTRQTIILSMAQTFLHCHRGALECIYSFVSLQTYWFQVCVRVFFLSGWFDHLRNWFYPLLPHKVAAEVLCDLMVVQSERYAAFNWEFLTGSIVYGHEVQVC